VCHYYDTVISVKTFWRPFLLFSWQKRNCSQNCSHFKVTRTRIQNPYYCERLLLEYMQTCLYYNPYMTSRTWTRISVNPALLSDVMIMLWWLGCGICIHQLIMLQVPTVAKSTNPCAPLSHLRPAAYICPVAWSLSGWPVTLVRLSSPKLVRCWWNPYFLVSIVFISLTFTKLVFRSQSTQ